MGHQMTDSQTQLNQIEELQNTFSQTKDANQKLQMGIAFMETSLAEGDRPNFKNFWDGRKLCTELFKENLSPPLRSVMWAKFCALTQEARRLKTIQDEEKAFEAEQIGSAIDGIESMVENLKNENPIHLKLEGLKESVALKKHATEYLNLQGKLALLNAYSSRITGIRKELAKTSIRFQTKTLFFNRLSKAGDGVFPMRREMIQQIGALLEGDVDNFCKSHFGSKKLEGSLKEMREEIKFLQQFAKELSIDAKTFTAVRKLLSAAWDKLQQAGKERHAEWEGRQQKNKEIVDQILVKLKTFSEKITEENTPLSTLEKESEALMEEIHQAEIGRHEVQQLRSQHKEARQPLDAKLQIEKDQREAVAKEKELERIKVVKAFETKLKDALLSLNTVEFDSLKDEFEKIPANGVEKTALKRLFHQIKEALLIQKEEALLIGDPNRVALKEAIELKNNRLAAYKNSLDNLRKKAGVSGLDFAESMRYHEEIHALKSDIEELSQSIDDLYRQLEG